MTFGVYAPAPLAYPLYLLGPGHDWHGPGEKPGSRGVVGSVSG